MKRMYAVLSALCAAAILLPAALLIMRASYPRPFLQEVKREGIGESLVFAVIRAESGFDEEAVSRAGAVGLMQIRPSTAQFVCEREGMEYSAEKLTEGAYNISVGCGYLRYLLEKFGDEQTALAAYNAGEGTVREWLQDPECSPDGARLKAIPFAETAAYLKKVEKFKKFYQILYR